MWPSGCCLITLVVLHREASDSTSVAEDILAEKQISTCLPGSRENITVDRNSASAVMFCRCYLIKAQRMCIIAAALDLSCTCIFASFLLFFISTALHIVFACLIMLHLFYLGIQTFIF